MENKSANKKFLSIQNLHKKFIRTIDGEKHDTIVLDNFSLDIEKGEIVALFGPNGCGKSTLLNLIVGLENPDSGNIIYSPEISKNLSLGYAFQHYADTLFPWRTVINNIALKFEIDGVARKERKARAREFADYFGLSLPWDAYPYQLSGGQKQMTNLLRLLAYRPNLCLLDEPLSALDYQNALDVMEKMSSDWASQDTTVLFISHDIEQAIFLADRVVILTKRPMQPKLPIRVPFKMPRTLDILETTEFFEIRTQALRAFVQEVNA